MLGCPSLDLGPQPEPRAPASQVNHRAGHVVVASLVLADTVAVRETKDRGHIVGVDQVIDGDSPSHERSIRRWSAYAATPVMIPSAPMYRLRV